MEATTYVATVESNHMVKVPDSVPIGEEVIIMRIPSMATLLADSQRRAQFAAMRAIVQEAIEAGYPRQQLTNKEIVALVKHARQSQI